MAKLARAADDQSEQEFRNQSKEVKNLLVRVRGLVLFTMQCRRQRLGENEMCKPTLWYVLYLLPTNFLTTAQDNTF